ncbi:hypothetical protein GHT06_010127 [Daphnia sinensis]|uniref:Gustatory receptor n=1 Tax=Daphnia sinensis TaxID=1820382 RepID=A0AAD5LI00_9CRUS|nr:hypothetical protein GHT06_010127 [Daphnia sinensis]
MLKSQNQFYSTFFKSLDVWMQLLGIQLDPFPSAFLSKRGAICLYSFSFLMFFINVSSNFYFTAMSFTSPSTYTHQPSRASTSEIWSKVIDFGSYNLMAIGTHAALLAIQRRPEWKSLWHNLKQLAAEHHDRLFFAKCRRAITIVLVCLTAEILTVVIRAVNVMVDDKKRRLMLKLTDMISTLTEIYAISGLAVFATIGWITYIKFVQLHDQLNLALDSIKHQNNPSSQTTTRRTWTDLRRWRRTYVTLNETVSHLGECFGPFVLIWITYIFINVIAISFYIVDGVRNTDPVLGSVSLSVFLLVRHLAHLLLLATISVTLQKESLNISKPLRKMRFDEPLLQRQVDTMIMEVMQFPTIMTAMDLFQVDLTLIPTLIGTSLTYLIILWQFQTGERGHKPQCE